MPGADELRLDGSKRAPRFNSHRLKHAPVWRTCWRCKEHKLCYATRGTCPDCARDYQREYTASRKHGPPKRVPPNKACASPGPLDIAWAAGFLEGEAWFGSRHGSAMLSVAQVEWDPIVKLVRWFGGSVTPTYVDRDKHPNWNCSVVWRVSGARARGVMMTVYPFMSPKRQAAIREVVACPA